MTAIAPVQPLSQRMDALRIANKVRSDRATLKRDLKAGRVSVRDVLLDPPEIARMMKVYDLLIATPKYGRSKVPKILQICRISPSKTIGGLTPRQRTELVSMLRGAVPIANTRRSPRGGTAPDAQHMRALKGANDLRLGRSSLKRQVAAGEKTVADVLREMPESAMTMTIAELIMSQHRWGATRTRRFLLRALPVPLLETKPVGRMTVRQCDEVTHGLERWL